MLASTRLVNLLTAPPALVFTAKSDGSETVAEREEAAVAAQVMHVVRVKGWSQTLQQFHLNSQQLLTLQKLYRSLQVSNCRVPVSV